MTWPEVLDRWSVPPTLIEMWEFNRKKILEYVQGQFPKHASLELLNSLVLNPGDPTLRRALVYVEPPKSASLANFSDVPVKQKPAEVFVDVVTSPEQPKQPEPKVKDPWYNPSGPRWRKPRDHNEEMAEIHAKQEQRRKEKLAEETTLAEGDERRRRVMEIAAQANAVRPWR